MTERKRRRKPAKAHDYQVRKTTTERRTNHLTRRFVAEMSQKAQAAGGTDSRQTDIPLKAQKKLRTSERAKPAAQKVEEPTPVCIGADQIEP